MTTNNTRPVDRSTGTRNSAPTSTESGGRSPSGPASQRGYCRATYSAKSLRSERCRLRRASERPGSLDAARRTSQRASSATNSLHSRHARLEPASPGHLFVQQDDAVGLAPQQRDRVVAVGRSGHREPLVLEVAPVRRESLDFVIHPEDGLRPHHQSKLMTTGEAGQRRTYLATCCAFSWSASAPSATSC